jgi:hypothetical protein
MGPRNSYKDMLDNVVSPITCVSMNHQNQLEQMANGAMFPTESSWKQDLDAFQTLRETAGLPSTR